MRRGRSIARCARLVCLAGAALLAGCGDPALWERYRAERAWFHASRLLERADLERGGEPEGESARARRALERVVAQFPASRWAASPEGPGRDVAAASGRAALGLARLDEIDGDDDAAALRYAGVRESYAALTSIALQAAVSEARALERAGRWRDAAVEWRDVALRFTEVVGSEEGIAPGVLEAPLAAARCWTAAGDSLSGLSVLAECAPGLERSLARSEGSGASTELIYALASLRAAQGDAAAGLALLRPLLERASSPRARGRALLALAECAIRASALDSGLAYARRGEFEEGGAARARFALMAAECWERNGSADSAAHAYGRAVDAARPGSEAEAEARSRRGQLLERTGRWEQARSEYRALSAAVAGQPLALAALRRIVQHHAAVGEFDLSRFEGRRAVETVDLWLSVNSGAEAELRLRRGKADLLSDVGDWEGAFAELALLWQRYARSGPGAQAGLDAARIAGVRLADSRRASGLYRDVAERGRWQVVREQAQQELERSGERASSESVTRSR